MNGFFWLFSNAAVSKMESFAFWGAFFKHKLLFKTPNLVVVVLLRLLDAP